MIRSSSRRADHGGSLDFNVSERRLFTVGELRDAGVCSPDGELRKRPPTVAALLLGALERFDFLFRERLRRPLPRRLGKDLDAIAADLFSALQRLADFAGTLVDKRR